ncbi:hypothetical protein RBH29_01215 [Herbivorax sp. ANBcel31]|uniref:hypothetical protein n=1 Tax=Herbivorax sp. ANBcel31 TaxID=3069754 RepID=UPI0027B289F4|nr:hypothetical protein [Herbivorax sp. ANBcel31]MDQ2085057.1 hypothetical protein [Herbivorax sp. ANBcel31]
MYRVFCESFPNMINSLDKNSTRFMVLEPLWLLLTSEQYHIEKELCTERFKKVSTLLHYMETHKDTFPKFKAFLWTLEPRGIYGKYYDVSTEEELSEQAKGVNMILSLMYWMSS